MCEHWMLDTDVLSQGCVHGMPFSSWARAEETAWSSISRYALTSCVQGREMEVAKAPTEGPNPHGALNIKEES